MKNYAIEMRKIFKENTVKKYAAFAAHCDPKYVNAIAKQAATKETRVFIIQETKEISKG